jgi:2-dehydropantoate 2-reductase
MSQQLRSVGIMGAGSIGCWVGGRLLARGATRVVLVGRERTRAELAAWGLHLADVGGAGAIDVPAERARVELDPGALRGCDAVLVCVKSGQTEAAARALASTIRPDALVCSLQNGVRNADVLREHLGARCVLAGIVEFNVVSRGEGRFHRGLDGDLIVEERGEAAWLVAALREAGLPVATRTDLAPDQWTKLLVNLNNAVSALSDAPTRSLILNPGYRRVVAALIEEALGVLRRAGIRPARLRGVPVGLMPRILRAPTPLVRLVTGRQMRVDPEARSSMWEDLTRGRPTEVDYLNGEIVRLAATVGLEAPLNRRIQALVHEAEVAGAGSPGLGPAELWQRLTRP